MPQKALRGRWTVQVAANSLKTAHTWQRRMPHKAWQVAFHQGANENGQVGRWDVGKGEAYARHFPPDSAVGGRL